MTSTCLLQVWILQATQLLNRIIPALCANHINPGTDFSVPGFFLNFIDKNLQTTDYQFKKKLAIFFYLSSITVYFKPVLSTKTNIIMKKTIYGLLFLSLAGVVSCEKESLEKNTEATTETRGNLEKANVKNYAIGSNPTSLGLLRKEYTFGTSPVFGSGTSLSSFLYYGVGAYDDDIAILGRPDANSSDITYQSGIGNNKYGLVKFNGANFLLDEIELIDDDINKLYGLRNGTIYKLTYSAGNFDATQIYVYPGSTLTRRFTIAPVSDNTNAIRLYTASAVINQQTTLSYLQVSTIAPYPSTISTNVTIPISGSGNLSSFTAINYSNPTSTLPKYYVVVGKEIFQISSSDLIITSVSFDNPVNDCSFYIQ